MANPAAVLALVLAMTAVGASALLWTWPTFGLVRRGFELLVGSTVALLAWAGWAALNATMGDQVQLVGDDLFSGGWDGILRRWTLNDRGTPSDLAETIGRAWGFTE